jgi:CRP/FNR family transcriptional regulator, anaerobic regulatory protein
VKEIVLNFIQTFDMNDKSKIANYINKLFPQFEPALKEKLLEHCSVRDFKAGEILMQTGQYFKSTVLIAEGRVKLYRQGEEGEEFFMYYIEPGGACALSMICAAKQETSEIMAKAVDDTVALLVPVTLMDQLMHDYKSWYYFVIETYRNRYEELLVLVDNIVFKGMDERLEFYLKNQYQKLKTRQLHITHQEIANDLNSSREVISRLLKKMEQQNKLILNRNFIEWLGEVES